MGLLAQIVKLKIIPSSSAPSDFNISRVSLSTSGMGFAGDGEAQAPQEFRYPLRSSCRVATVAVKGTPVLTSNTPPNCQPPRARALKPGRSGVQRSQA
jgi:hypothetical protein